MLRNLNRTYAGRRILDIGKTGVLGSSVPAVGAAGASYLYADVIANSWQLSEVRGRITATTLPTGSWYAWNDGRFQVDAGVPDGIYTVNWERFLFGAPLSGSGTLTLAIGHSGSAVIINFIF